MRSNARRTSRGSCLARRSVHPLALQRAPAGDGVDVVEQAEIAVAAQLGQGPAVGLAVLGSEGSIDPPRHRADDERARLGGDLVAQVLARDLGVADGPEHAAEPAQLVAQGIGDRAVEEATVRGERAAQAAHRDPHLVHGVGTVDADQRVERDQRPPPAR